MTEPRGGPRWIVNLRRVPAPAVRLICVPFAGAGTTPFRPWLRHLPPSIEAWAVCLPGREHRSAEPFVTDVAVAAERIADELAALDGPLAVFGHSLGAILGFEALRALARRGRGDVRHLWASARPAPQLEVLRTEHLHVLPDAELVRALRELGGTSDALFDDPEWMAFMLPIARADLTLHAGYRYQPGPPLRCPISAFGGVDDRWVDRAQLAAWREHGGGFALRTFPGDHFYLHDAGPAIVAAIAETLAAEARR